MRHELFLTNWATDKRFVVRWGTIKISLRWRGRVCVGNVNLPMEEMGRVLTLPTVTWVEPWYGVTDSTSYVLGVMWDVALVSRSHLGNEFEVKVEIGMLKLRLRAEKDISRWVELKFWFLELYEIQRTGNDKLQQYIPIFFKYNIVGELLWLWNRYEVRAKGLLEIG